MVAYRLTPKAADDLDGIYEYTITNFGLDRAQDYLNGLHRRFGDLAERPALGRGADRHAPGLRRYPYRSHIVFYMLENEGVVLVQDILRRGGLLGCDGLKILVGGPSVEGLVGSEGVELVGEGVDPPVDVVEVVVGQVPCGVELVAPSAVVAFDVSVEFGRSRGELEEGYRPDRRVTVWTG